MFKKVLKAIVFGLVVIGLCYLFGISDKHHIPIVMMCYVGRIVGFIEGFENERR